MSHSIMGASARFRLWRQPRRDSGGGDDFVAGGLAIINPLNVRPLILTSGLLTLTDVVDLGRVLVEQSPLRAEDTLLIHSVSGRDAITIDVALAAVEPAAQRVIAMICSTAAQNPRHSAANCWWMCADITTG